MVYIACLFVVRLGGVMPFFNEVTELRKNEWGEEIIILSSSQIKSTFRVVLSQTNLILTKSIKKSNNIYGTKSAP